MPDRVGESETAPVQSLRVDRWLWHTRIVRQRKLAVDLATKGNVRVNGQKIDRASYLVKPGDVLTIGQRGHVQVIEVIDLPDKRGSATVACTCYRELENTRQKHELIKS